MGEDDVRARAERNMERFNVPKGYDAGGMSVEQTARLLRTVQAKYEMRILRAEGVRSEFMELVADVALIADVFATHLEQDVP